MSKSILKRAAFNAYFVSGLTTQRLYALNDAMGNITSITDSEAQVKQRFSYSIFGEVSRTDANFNVLANDPIKWSTLFHGETYDLDTNWSNYGYRYHSTILGKWLSRDTIGEEGGLNLYGFVGNNAINYEDLYGESWGAIVRGVIYVGGSIVKFIGKRTAKKAARCLAIYEAYDISAKAAQNCKSSATCCDFQVRLAALLAEIGGRSLYLKNKCDKYLPGSIARGSANAAKGHRDQLKSKIFAFSNCLAAAVRKGCADLPELGSVAALLDFEDL